MSDVKFRSDHAVPDEDDGSDVPDHPASDRATTSARPRTGAGHGRQLLVESGKAFGRNHTVTSRQGIKCRVEFDILIEPMSDTAQADDLGTYRKCGHEPRAL